MKLLMYADVHASFTSSILPIHMESSKHTTRLQMVIDSIKWMYGMADKLGVDYIINLGDLFDNHILRSEEITAISEAYTNVNPNKIPELYVLGNHETLDTSRNFNSASLLNNIDYMRVITEPTKIDDNISVLPHMKPDDVTHELLSSIKNHILVSHIDIKGSKMTQHFTADFGVEPFMLNMYFGHVFNGHIHTYERIGNHDIFNTGSLTSTSFADDNNYVPGIFVYDSDKHECKRYSNPFAILFRRIKCNSVSELIRSLDNLDSTYKYVIRATVPYDIKQEVSDILNSRTNIVTSRVVADISNLGLSKNQLQEQTLIDLKNDNVKKEFMNFLSESNNEDSYKKEYESILKHPYKLYVQVMNEVED